MANTTQEKSKGKTYYHLIDNVPSASEIGTDDITFPTLTESTLGNDTLSGMVRGRMAMGSNFNEKLRAFRNAYPEGDIAVSNLPGYTEPQFVFRKTKDQKYSMVDPSTIGDIGNDIIEFVGSDGFQIMGELLATKGIGSGFSLFKTFGLSGLGNIGGQFVKEGTQSIMGENVETFGEIASRAAPESVVAGLGGTVGQGVTRVGEGVFSAATGRGGGLVGTTEGGEKALRAAKELDLPAPLPTQVANIPVLEKVVKQAQGVSGAIMNYFDMAKDKSLSKLMTLKTTDAPNFYMELNKVVDNTKNAIVSKLFAKGGGQKKSATGEGLQNLAQKWSKVSQAKVSEYYELAKAVEAPQFNYDNFKLQIGETIQNLAKAKSTGSGTAELTAVVRKIAKFLENPSPKVIEGLEKNVVVDEWQQLDGFKRELYDMTIPSGGRVDYQGKLAKEVRDALTVVIENPQNANREFRDKYRAAVNAARERFKVLDMYFIKQLFTSKPTGNPNPQQLAEQFNSPNRMMELRLIKRLSQETDKGETFQNLKSYAYNDLLEKVEKDPNAIGKYLKNMDSETLEVLFDNAELQAFKQWDEVIRNASSMSQKLKSTDNTAKDALNSIKQGNKQQLQTLVEQIKKQGGKQKGIGLSFRSAIVDDMLRQAVVFKDGRNVIDFKKLNSTIQDYGKKGFLRFLTRQDIRMLRNQRLYTELFSEGVDSGASLQSAEVASGVAVRPSKSAFLTLAKYMGIGRLITSKFANRLLLGAGTPKTASKARDRAYFTFRSLGLIGAQILTDFYDEESDKNQPIQLMPQ